MTTSRIRTVLEMIKFEHSIFALPFALTAAVITGRALHRSDDFGEQRLGPGLLPEAFQ